MKKLFILILITITGLLYAEDASSDKKTFKFPGKFGFEFIDDCQADIVNNRIKQISETIPMMPQDSNSGLYNKISVKGNVSFEIGKYYNLNLWIQDFFDLRFNINDAGAESVFPRNGLYFGINNSFRLPKIMDIGVNFVYCLRNDLIKLKEPFVYESVEYILAPSIMFSGNYDFGLSWMITQNFNVFIYPNYYDVDKNKVYKFTEITGVYSLNYEFFHFFAPKEIQGRLFVMETLTVSKWSAKHATDDLIKDYDGDYQSELNAGFIFSINSISPSAAFYFKTGTSYDAENTFGRKTYFGMKAGFTFTKDLFTFGISYLGRILTESNYRAVVIKPDNALLLWENHIETFIRIKI